MLFQTDQTKAAKKYYNQLIADTELETLHIASCAAHEKRIGQVLGESKFRERRDWILSESWD